MNWLKGVNVGIVVLAMLLPYVTSFAADSVVVDTGITNEMLNRAIFVNDSLIIDNTRLAGLLALSQEGQPVLPPDFWKKWYLWSPIFLLGFASCYYTIK